MTYDEQLTKIVPHVRQFCFQQLEFYAFIHFTVNTFTDREWGDGTESPLIFDPESLDTEQWVKAVKSAGMRGLILTCKHHDGFCLWPSKLTDHTVAASPWKNGNGDVVKEAAEACKKHGIKFGVYLSPWDRNCPLYGRGKPYDDFFAGQLTELLTNYGEIFSVWFDGACGEGIDGKKQHYDWERYYSVIRTLQPNACISVCGPDIRWCGNEAGHTRISEWSVVPERTKDTEKISEKSQHSDNEEFRLRKITASDSDLGSREVLKNENELIWYPAEVNTSIRPGWFWHESENDKVRSLDELIHIYNNSVGGNSTFLLNIPPARNGLLCENDVKRLAELGEYIRNTFQTNLSVNAILSADSGNIEAAKTDDYSTYYIADKGRTTAEITAEWERPVTVGCIVLKENILCSQRVESFTVEAELNGEFAEIYRGTVIGYKRIIPLKNITTNRIRIKITDSRTEPTLAFLGIYERKNTISHSPGVGE
ncbi:MAG: alpha-L-fucosidase [Oscillospiraceae bacterium]|nr:alpha-L-fucosidase [Oscillospiraceae bacterium]